MVEKDTLRRFIFENAPLRGEYVHLDDAYQTIMNQHTYSEPVKQLLGEALAAAALLSATIKIDGRLILQFRGSGKLKLLLVDCDNKLNMRALVQTTEDLSYDELMASFRQGILGIILESGPDRTPYQGIVEWQGSTLAESIEGYFQSSEQLATKIWLSTDHHSAAGLLLQVVPGSEKQTADGLAGDMMQVNWDRITKIMNIFEPKSLLDHGCQELIEGIFPEDDVRLFEAEPAAFKCTCSRQRGVNAIELLGQQEAEEELKLNHVIIVTCDFCNTNYEFNHSDVANIFDSDDDTPPPSNVQLH